MGYWVDRFEKAKAELRLKATYPLSGHDKQSDGPKAESKHREYPATSENILSKRIIEKERCLNEHLDRLEKVYPSGLYYWLYVHDRNLYARIDEIEDQLNGSFRDGDPIDKFKRLLREYWNAHMRAIRVFRESGQPEAPPEARQARIAEREAHV